MIILKSPDEINKMRRSNMIVYEVLERLTEIAKPGVTGNDLDRIACEYILKQGATPTFIGYMDYPKSLCVSVNERVVHGIPDNRPLEAGDIVGIDCGVTCEGYVGDSARTIPIGEVSSEAKRLLTDTRAALFRGIAAVSEGNRIGDVGHGIGRRMHEPPQVPNFGRPGTGPRLKVGMVLAIEPMLNLGTSDVRILDDKWTVVTEDGKLSAHFEHSVALTPKGAWILSQP